MPRLIFYSELKPRKGIPFSRPWIDELIKRGLFPKKVPLSANRKPWLEDEIDAYLAERAAERDTIEPP